jgi:hypothetical protein
MKKKNLILSVMLFFSILPMALFTGCDKDTNCYLEVKVLNESTVDPNSGLIIPGNPMPGTEVEVFQDGGTVYAKGITDGDGIYKTHFSAPAIVKIKARIDTGLSILHGESSVRLIQGETVPAVINLTR